ncbi:hypothetical protein BDV18DRAFT_163448 [Aspergillus unguis]
MAETNPPSSAPAPDAGEAPAERAPAELEATPQESAPEPSKENTEKDTNGAEETPAENTAAEESKKESTDVAVEQPNASDESVEAKKSEEGAAAAAAPEANGTPSSAKKSSSKRKSTGGDSKSKLSRKKSMTRITHLDAKPGEYYLARLRSFPPWPAIICDEEILPQSLLVSRPVTAVRPDGTYREDYADGGKRAAERTFPVMFFGTNEFAWIVNTDLSPLDSEACKDVSEKGKSKALVNAYAIAAEGHDLAHYKTLLLDHQRAIEQEEEEREAQEAAKAAAKAEREAKKNKRKSMEIHDDVDMDDAEGGKQPKSSKKRKKAAETEGEDKPAKTPKTGTKLKLTTPKNPADEKKGGKAKQSASKKGKKAANDESDDSGPAKEPEPKVNLEEAKKRREREVLFTRHHLQKGFISRDKPPKEEEMAQMSGHFTKLENLDDLEVSIIRKTKIHKVLRMILKLPSIPRDEEFNFRKRALDILSKWKNVLDSEGAPSQEKDKEATKANGINNEKEGEPKSEKEDETKLDTPDQDTPMPDADEKKTEETPAPAKDEAEKVAPEAEEKEEKQKEVETEKPAVKADEKPEEQAEKPADETAEKAAEAETAA